MERVGVQGDGTIEPCEKYCKTTKGQGKLMKMKCGNKYYYNFV